MLQFSSEVEKVLRQSGWTPSRSVSVNQWVDPLVREGFKPLPGALKILENLGGLEITPPTSPSNLFFPSKIILDPYYTASGELDRVKKWEKRYSLMLFPLGEYDPNHMIFLADNGQITSG